MTDLPVHRPEAAADPPAAERGVGIYPPGVLGGGAGLPGFARMPERERRKTTRHHYRHEIYALNRDALARELPLWRENAEENRAAWEKGASLREIIKERRPFRNGVCAVCGSGPSLGYELPDLHRLRDRITVVAADSAVYPLKLVGVLPDFIFVRSAGPVTVDLLHRYPTGKSLFVLPVGANPELVRRIEGRILFYVPVDEHEELASWAAAFPAHLPRFVLKPSTAAMAFHFARHLECANYCLEGFDFAFSYGKLWCDAVRYLDDPATVAALRDPAERELVPFRIADIFSESTQTNYRLHMSAEELFRAVRYEGMENVYNASLGILFNLRWLPLKYAVEMLPEVDRVLPKDSQLWKAVETYYPKESDSRLINEVTSNTYIALTSRNIIVNHEAGHVRHKVSELFERAGEFAKRVAVVAGAGPSLDDTLEAMRRHRDRYFLMAVDASLNPLLEAGLRPDATISIDPERRVGRFFEGVDTAGLTLIAGLTTHPEVAAMWKGDIYWSFMISPVPHLCRLISLYDKVSLTLPYGNCGSTGILLCRSLGFGKIVYTGVDFAYTHDRGYCRNMKIEKELRPESREGVEEMLARKRTGSVPATDVRGDPVTTDATLERYALNLVGAYEALPENGRNIYNAGLGITRGIPVVDFDAFFAAEAPPA